MPFVIGFILAYILAPFVEVLESYRLSRSIAIIVLYILLVGIVVLFIFYAVPLLISDLNKLVEFIPHYAKYIQDTLLQMQDGFSRFPLPEGVRQVIGKNIMQVEQISLGVIQGFLQGLIGLVGQSFSFILVPIVSYYFLRDFNHIGRYLLKAIPVRHREEVTLVGKEINQVLRRFIKGSFLVAFLVGLLTTIGMYLIGMDFPVLIGAMVGVTNVIPYFGAIISSVPALLLALSKSKWLALYVLGLMIFIQQIEGNFISPKILGSSVGLHPLLIMFALLAGGQFWGLWGLLLAVPLAAVLKVLFRHLYLRLI
jgi:predicted PurR-regulated permease PerM